MNRGVPFGTALRAFSRAVGHGERRPIVDADEGRPALPDADSSNLSGWLQNFGARFRNTSDVPHEGPTYNPGMEQFATDTLFPGSGTAGMRPDPTPEEIAASRAAIGQFGRDVFFGPERGSVIPFVDDASDPERLIRDWGLSEQEFRLSGRAFSEGRLGAGSGWGALGIMAAVPVVGWTGRGLVKLGRATVRGATAGADTAPVLRAARRDAVPDELRALDELDARWRDGQFEVGFDDPRRLDLIQDLDRSGVVEFAEMWGSDFDFIRNFQQLTGDVIAGGSPNIPLDLWIGLRAIEHGPLTSAPVYRGLSMAPEELAQIAVGSGYALPPSSFTYVRGEALDFMSIRTSGQPVMLVVEEGASALPIGAIWQGAGLGEVVSNGLFEVAAINRVTTGAGARGREIAVKHGEYTEITLRQVEPIRVSPEPRYRGGKMEDVSIVNADAIAGRAGGEAAQAARSPLVQEGATTVPGAWAERAVRAGDAAEVPTEWAQRFQEYDRRTNPVAGSDLDAIKASILEEGFRDPLIIEVGLNGRASLIEGNHRLAAALELGLENVPVRVITSRGGPAGSRFSSEGIAQPTTVRLQEGVNDGWYLKPSEAIAGVPDPVSSTPNLDRIGRAGGEVGQAASAGAEAAPISRVFEGGAAPTPVSQTDSDLFRILSDDGILQSIEQTPFVISRAETARGSAGGPATTGRLTPSTAEDALQRLTGPDQGVVIPPRLQAVMVERYGDSFIEVSRGFDPYEEARQMLRDVDIQRQWDQPYEFVGVGGRVRRDPMYSPTRGSDPDAGYKFRHDAEGKINLDLVSDAIAARARTYQDVHNKLVTDRMYQDLADNFIDIGLARFGAQEFEVLSTAMRATEIRPTIAVPGSAIGSVFDNGAILNQYMTMTTMGALAPHARVTTELSVMGLPLQLGPVARPVYGYATVARPQIQSFADGLNDVLRTSLGQGYVMGVGRPAGYGEVHFVFGPETASRSTFTIGDSLHSPVIARPLTNPSSGDVGLAAGPFLATGPTSRTTPIPAHGRQSYVEAHVTQPNFRDVTEIHINEGPYSTTREIENIRGAMRALTGNDVDIYVLRPRKMETPDNIIVYDSYLVEPGGRVSTVPVG